MVRRIDRLVVLAGAMALAGCSSVIPPANPPSGSAPVAATAALMGVSLLAPAPLSAIKREDAASALASFTESCRVVTRREDLSGLTQPADWQGACDKARGFSGDPRDFFASQFQPVQVGPGKAFATGYFEPEIAGCRTRRPGCTVPVYPMPRDLVRQWPATMPESERTGRPPLGRVDASGQFVPYYTRAEIEDGALDGRVTPIAWAVDPVEFFFLQIQGSGRLRLDDGGVLRIGYDGQNGHSYTGIGGVMRERGLLGDGPGQYSGSMQGIMAYISDNPVEGKALMRLNESWVFFRLLDGDGPLGSLGVPVRRESSVAVDPRYVPYGAPVLLDLDRDVADGLWIAQDTGGAIKGPNRFDTFWGAGDDARLIAGGMSGRGSAIILLPKVSAARLPRQ